MADIFISYSSKDREKAEQLTELLASAGLSVWIDKQGINVATSWSEEIVHAIDGCKAFVVMLSPSSVASHNVVKEVSLASEKKKKILPLDLEPVEIPPSMQYALAGIQRAAMTNIDSIIRALGKLGLEATGAPQPPKIVKESDSRKSLMILPFEDLSPTGDNGWFVDGMASELVNTLSNVKSLKLIDWNTSQMLKNKSIKTTELAREFQVRYFVEGQVRKFGDQIKISVTLLDIETGDHLWQDNLKGMMQDVFDIQEAVAKKVLDGLDVILTKKEEERVEKKLTENAEAYELFLKGNEYFRRHTKSDLERALVLYEEAVRLDPDYAAAYAAIANTCMAMYRIYTHDPGLLERAESAAARVRELEGETAQYFWVMSYIMLRRGDAEGALSQALAAVKRDPEYAPGYDALGFAYQALGRKEEAVQAREKYVSLRENERVAHFNLLIALHELGDTPEYRDHLRLTAERAITVYERYLRLTPDDYNARVNFANVLHWADRHAEALEAAQALEQVEALDGYALYNLACLFLQENELAHGMSVLQRAIEKGYRSIETIRRDPDLDPLRGTPEFEELMKGLSEP